MEDFIKQWRGWFEDGRASVVLDKAYIAKLVKASESIAPVVDKEAIQRGLGIIEGLSWIVCDEVADALLTAVEVIEGALGNEA